jgi:hypothetical protein
MNIMPNKYCLAILFLFAASVSVAEAAQRDNATAVSGKGSADQAAAPAPAMIADQPMFKFGGFGSFGASHSSQDLGDYVLDGSLPKGAGRSSDWSVSNNSRIAAHLNANFTPQVTALVQVDSEYHSDGTFRPEAEWFSVKYAFTPNAYIRVGRVVLPTFMDSENRDVGYSFTWVHPPVDLYHQLSIPSSDGMDAMYRTEIGEAVNTLKAIFGTNKTERPTSVTTSNDMMGIFDTIEYGSATFHGGYQTRNSSTRNELTGVTGPWIENKDLSLGASYDPGDWFVISEWIQRRSTYKTGAMYVSAGYRINKFTPYLTHSQNSRGSFLPGYPTTPTSTTSTLAKRSQTTNSLGMRWDFMRNYDFKIQYDRVTLSDDSNGYLINVQTDPATGLPYNLSGTTFHVISAVVDFVF